MGVGIELVVDAHATIGEAPTWAADERALYWMDVKGPTLFRWDEATGESRHWSLTSDVGAFALVADPPGAMVAMREGLARLDFGTGALDRVGPPPFDPELFRFNEGGIDPSGRWWIGVMFDPRGGEPEVEHAALNSFSFETGLVPEGDVSQLHNGMAWSNDGRRLYLSHSKAGRIYRFAVDPETRTLGERTLFAEVSPDLGEPDGAAIDAEDHYWCAVHGAGRLHRYRTDGTLERSVLLPVSQPTMCAFGGADLDWLYVTSAAQGLGPDARRAEPHAGGVFRFRPGVRGAPRAVTLRV